MPEPVKKISKGKQQLIEAMITEIMAGVSTRIREIVREEIDIERKRVRKQLLEEFRDRLNKPVQKKRLTEAAPVVRHAQPVRQVGPPKKKIDTGDSLINSILEDVQSDMEDMMPEVRFQPEHTVRDVVNETARRPTTSQAAGLWKPPAGEGYNFDPTRMDAAQVDWSDMVDALEARTSALPGDQK